MEYLRSFDKGYSSLRTEVEQLRPAVPSIATNP